MGVGAHQAHDGGKHQPSRRRADTSQPYATTPIGLCERDSYSAAQLEALVRTHRGMLCSELNSNSEPSLRLGSHAEQCWPVAPSHGKTVVGGHERRCLAVERGHFRF